MNMINNVKKDRNKSFSIIFYCGILMACALSILSFRYVGRDWIPEDFHPKDVILLIEEHPFNSKQNDRMAEWLEKEYHWRYEIVTMGQVNKNKKYEDKKLYPFLLLWSDVWSSEVTTAAHGFTYHDVDGHFYDRNTNKDYPVSKKGNGFGQIGYRKVIKAIKSKFKDE